MCEALVISCIHFIAHTSLDLCLAGEKVCSDPVVDRRLDRHAGVRVAYRRVNALSGVMECGYNDLITTCFCRSLSPANDFDDCNR